MNRTTSKSTNSQKIAAHFARVVVACMIMMWGVINLVHNGLLWRSAGLPDSSSWIISLGFVLVTGVFPLLMGVWILIRSRPEK